MIDYQSLGHRIRCARKAAKLTQEQLADLTDLCTAYIGHIERGTRKLSVETLCKLCDVLGLSADHLLGRKYKDSPSE